MHDQYLRIVSCTPGKSLDMPRRLHAVLLLAFSLIHNTGVVYCVCHHKGSVTLGTSTLLERSISCRHIQVCVRPVSTSNPLSPSGAASSIYVSGRRAMPCSRNIRRCQCCNAGAMSHRVMCQPHSPRTLTRQTREALENRLCRQRRYDNVVTSWPVAWVNLAAARL